MRTNGSYVKWQESAVQWCYHDADPDFGRFQVWAFGIPIMMPPAPPDRLHCLLLCFVCHCAVSLEQRPIKWAPPRLPQARQLTHTLETKLGRTGVVVSHSPYKCLVEVRLSGVNKGVTADVMLNEALEVSPTSQTHAHPLHHARTTNGSHRSSSCHLTAASHHRDGSDCIAGRFSRCRKPRSTSSCASAMTMTMNTCYRR